MTGDPAFALATCLHRVGIDPVQMLRPGVPGERDRRVLATALVGAVEEQELKMQAMLARLIGNEVREALTELGEVLGVLKRKGRRDG